MISFGAVLALLVAASSAYNGPLMCLRYCGNAKFDPICGSNGKDMKLFSSMCELKNAECGDKHNWFIKPTSECLALAGQPVDHFSIPRPHDIDELLAKPFSIKRQLRINSCNLICPQFYLPICAYDGVEYKIFANLCFLQMDNCERQQKFVQAPNAKCDFSVRVSI